MTKKALLWLVIIAPLLGASMVGLHVYTIYNEAFVKETKLFQIKNGEGFSHINYRLYREEVVNNPRVFHYLAKYKNKLNDFQAGTFEIPANSKMEDVLKILTEGTPISTKVTIPEGKNIYEVATILEEKELVTKDDFLKYVKDPATMTTFGISAPSLEGYLFPETYQFAPGTTVAEIVKTMVNEFKRRTSGLDYSKTNLTPHEVVILASVVEKETGAKIERPSIAGVFLNRLKKHMRLESDPTTIYGIYENYNGNLRKEDLLALTPYNTYKIPALPMGPIANPSLEAIKAVLEPEQHEFLFFVSKNDGTHIFTKNYKDHTNAVNEFQRNRTNREGKSWRNLKQ